MFDAISTKIEKIGIVPVVKIEQPENAVYLAEALIKGGINCAEITFRALGADRAIAAIHKQFPDMVVGAGTVLSCEQADRAIDAGAVFLVAPGLNPAVVRHTLDRGVCFMPGVSSASEIEAALELGLNFVKFFPAEQAGGIEYIKALSAPYSSVRFMPTGGVNENNVNAYLSFPKVFACGGSWMVAPQLIKDEKWTEITALCRAAVDKILGFELKHVGINCEGGGKAVAVAGMFEKAFGFAAKEGASSVFAGGGIEVMKSPRTGSAAHIAIATNSVLRASYALEQRGFTIDRASEKTDEAGRVKAVYLNENFGDMSVHLLQK